MNKIEFMRLWDTYCGLLTPTQQEITSLYFNLDLTVSEIAEQKGVSRQSVSECLATCKKQLEEYEEKLHFSRQNIKESLRVSFMTTDVARWAENFGRLHPEYAGELKELEGFLNKDYSDEVDKKLADPAVIKLLNKDYRQIKED